MTINHFLLPAHLPNFHPLGTPPFSVSIDQTPISPRLMDSVLSTFFPHPLHPSCRKEINFSIKICFKLKHKHKHQPPAVEQQHPQNEREQNTTTGGVGMGHKNPTALQLGELPRSMPFKKLSIGPFRASAHTSASALHPSCVIPSTTHLTR